MDDLSVSLRYYTSAALKRASSEFRSDPSDTSPGWFVEAYENEGYDRIAKLRRVTAAQALSIAEAIDGTARSTAIRNAVARQTREHDQTRARSKAFLENQLVETQRALARIRAEESDGPDA